jgi:flavodoxin
MNTGNHQYGPDTHGNGHSPRILIVYYSRTGNTKKVAEDLVKALGCDVERIIDTKKRTGPLGYLFAGRDAGKSSLTKIEEPKRDPSSYDLVLIGTPVWNDSVSTPIRTYLSMQKNKIASVAFFLTQLGNDRKAFDEMQKILNRPPIATLQLTKVQSLDVSDYKDKIGVFLRQLDSGTSK